MSKAQPGAAMRQFVVTEMAQMLRHFAIMYAQPSQAAIFHPDVMRQVQTHQDQYDLAVVLANGMLQELGFEVGEPTEPRFDKTRRAAAKKAAKPPKGLSAKERAEWEAQQGSATP
jgi:hypothetical protein